MQNRIMVAKTRKPGKSGKGRIARNMPKILGLLLLLALLGIEYGYAHDQAQGFFARLMANTSVLNSSSAYGNGTCRYGYACRISSYGCAVPGAVYNCPAISVNGSANATVAVNLEQELGNSAREGFTLNKTIFRSDSSSGCSKHLIGYCDNNSPGQFICVNSRYLALVSSQYSQTHQDAMACPMYFMLGNVSCGLDAGYCVVTKS